MGLTSASKPRQQVRELRGRLLMVSAVVVLVFLSLMGRLYVLQVKRGDEFANMGEANFIKSQRVKHDRGMILDRHGKILVDNRPAMNVEVTPYFLGDREKGEATLDQLFDLLALDQELGRELRSTIFKQRGLSRFSPIEIKRDVSWETVELIEAERSILKLNGVEIVEDKRRTYPYGTLAAHVLGYVNEIDRGRLNRAKREGNELGYMRGDAIGRSGIERVHERELRGSDGSRQIAVDAKGLRRQRQKWLGDLDDLPSKDPDAGFNVVLTIDKELQAAAEEAFDGAAGAVVAMDPNSGAILAMVSTPAFDPNVVTGAMGKDAKQALDENILKPWLNRPIQGLYAPGSTFKVITALAALEEGITTPQEQVFCPGYYRLGRRNWRCHKDSGHGHVDLKDALKLSCDTWFYQMADRMGINPIAEMGTKFGVGVASGLELPGEKRGLMPDEAFHDGVEKSTGGYQRGMALNTSIGQGSVLMHPLQLAVVYAALINGGRILEPRIVERIETADRRVERFALAAVESEGDERSDAVERFVEGQGPEVVKVFESKIERFLDLPEPSFQAVRDGLIAVTNEPGGTAYWRKSKVVPMAGKTGTAQVIRLGTKRLSAEEMAYFERDHAWFASYAPIEEPELVVIVVNEHSGHGGSKAAPIATKVIDAWHALKEGQRGAAKLEGGLQP